MGYPGQKLKRIGISFQEKIEQIWPAGKFSKQWLFRWERKKLETDIYPVWWTFFFFFFLNKYSLGNNPVCKTAPDTSGLIITAQWDTYKSIPLVLTIRTTLYTGSVTYWLYQAQLENGNTLIFGLEPSSLSDSAM